MPPVRSSQPPSPNTKQQQSMSAPQGAPHGAADDSEESETGVSFDVQDQTEKGVHFDSVEVNYPANVGRDDDDGEDDDLHDPTEDQVYGYIARLSRQDDRDAVIMDKEQLDNFVRQAGEFSFGVDAVEVYTFEVPILQPASIWVSKTFLSQMKHAGLDEKERQSVMKPEPVTTGVDLVGKLWSIHQDTHGRVKDLEKAADLGRGILNTKAPLQIEGTPGRPVRDKATNLLNPPIQSEVTPVCSPTTQSVPSTTTRVDSPGEPQPDYGKDIHILHWTDLKSLITDADSLHSGRLEYMSKAGLERATGVVFNMRGNSGMVVYFARTGADPKLLTSWANEAYMCRAASLVGSVIVTDQAKRANVEYMKLSTGTVDFGDGAKRSKEITKDARTGFAETRCERFGRHVLAWARKARGGGAQIPRAMSFEQTLITMVGTFLGLAVIWGMDLLFEKQSEDVYYLIMAPFSAVMMLQYGLTGAPAAQPRNVILGFLVAGGISLGFSHIPESAIPKWIRALLAVSCANGAMVKLGIPNPPASALGLTYSLGGFDWMFLLMTVVSSFVSFVPAIIINNLSKQRQYPAYWGYLPSWTVKKFRELTTKTED